MKLAWLFRIIVGINDYVDEEEKIEIPILEIKKEVEDQQVERLEKLKQNRNKEKVEQCLQSLSEAARSDKNLMMEFINCAKAYVTLGEMINVLKEEFGEYVEPREF